MAAPMLRAALPARHWLLAFTQRRARRPDHIIDKVKATIPSKNAPITIHTESRWMA
jgi:hypothetical protein